jgi:hypothetical protein
MALANAASGASGPGFLLETTNTSPTELEAAVTGRHARTDASSEGKSAFLAAQQLISPPPILPRNPELQAFFFTHDCLSPVLIGSYGYCHGFLNHVVIAT